MEYKTTYQHVAEAKYDCLLFDLHDTISPRSSALAYADAKGIENFMVQKLGIEADKVSEIKRVLCRSYGTTMAGLVAFGYNFDYDEYHSFIHRSMPYEILKPDHALRNLLLSLPFRKVIFSNGDKVHMAKVLRKLGLEDCFERVISFETLNPINGSNALDDEKRSKLRESVAEILDASQSALPETPVICKPFKNAFEQAFRIANINPQKTLFFDDSIRNIQFGKEIGLHTVLVGTSDRTEEADYALESIHNVREALPDLLE